MAASAAEELNPAEAIAKEYPALLDLGLKIG
jgi:hypothetical protein